MNREIKFRAWDKKAEFLAEVMTLSYPYGSGEVEWIHYSNGGGVYLSSKTEFELMQYTGLKDKNGKEIYEGDIVEWRYLNILQRNEVNWVHGGFVSIMTAFKDDLNEMQSLSLISRLDCEIIGNIHEHPELLKETSQ